MLGGKLVNNMAGTDINPPPPHYGVHKARKGPATASNIRVSLPHRVIRLLQLAIPYTTSHISHTHILSFYV